MWIGNETTGFTLELTQYTQRIEPYNLGDNEIHVAFRVEDFDAAYELRKKMGYICFENTKMGLYFISDPDGYCMEIVPTRT